jgi:hypothetical protein
MPPPEYSPWDMTDETRAQLGRLREESMYSGVPPGADVEAVVGQVGREQLIETMSGTTDRSSREWKNARDNLSRWRRGARHPSQANRDRLRGAAEANRRQEIGQSGRAHVRVDATVRTSKNRWGYAEADLTGPSLSDFLAASEAGDDELAAKIVYDAYGLDPEFVLGVEGIEGFEISW